MRFFKKNKSRIVRRKPVKAVINKNPLFPSHNEKGTVAWKSRAFLIEMFIVIGLFAYILIYSSLFNISNVKISVNELSRLDDIEQNIQSLLDQNNLFIFPSDNYLLLRPGSFAKSITDKFENQVVIEKIFITKEFPNTLNIDIQERTTSYLWSNSFDQYGLDNQGYLVNKINEEQELQLTSFLNNNDIDEQVGQQVINQNSLSKAVEFNSRIESLGLTGEYINIPEYECLSGVPQPVLPKEPEIGEDDDLEVINLNLNATLDTNTSTNLSINNENCNKVNLVLNAREFQIFTTAGWYIYFSIDDVDNQIFKLEATLKDSGIDADRLSYIDLRFGERVYLK